MKYRKLNYAEPAVLRGILTAIIALLLAVGVSIPEAWEDQADQIITAIGIVAPVVAGVWIRRSVTPANVPVPPAEEDSPVEFDEDGDVIGNAGASA